MAASGASSGARAVCEQEARKEAERLLADARLHVSDRHRAFLKYITDALFEGRTETVKAYSIAIDVFNRPASFDPSSDPIVRIEATRLRETLEKYYEELGDEPGARLDIPRGRYVPVFVERCHPPCPMEEVADLDTTVPAPAAEDTSDVVAALRDLDRNGPLLTWRTGAVGLAGICVACLGGLGLLRNLSPAPFDTQKPFVSLSMTSSDENNAAVQAVMQDLSISLARFGTLRLKSSASSARTTDDSASQASYDIKMRFAESTRSVSIWWQVSDTTTGEAFWTDEEQRPAPDGQREDALRDLVYGVSRRLAGPTGIVNTLELRNNLPQTSIGNICVLRGEFAIEMRDPAGLKAARPCLEQTIAVNPKNSDAMATLARLMLWTGRTTGDDSYFSKGADLANRSAAVSPSSPRAALAQMATQYQFGQTETAIAAGRRGVALNPENADLLAKLGMAVFLSGNWKEGADLANRAAEVAGQSLRDASFVLILNAYRQGDYVQAVYLARQVPAADTPTAVLKLAAVARIGDRSVTDREIAAARLQHPDIDRTVKAMFSGTRYDRGLEEALRRGISEAGLKAPEFASNGAM